MAQFVTHIQPTLLEASQGHVPHHHGHQVGVQHSSHLPHSGHNMPSPPTAHNHHQHHSNHHHNHHHQSPTAQISSPSTGHKENILHGKHGGGGKHEHCPSGHQSSGDGNTSFLRAARAGNLERVLEHLKNNIDINTSNANGLNALHLASKDGHIHVVSELLRRGAIVDSATKKGNTALHIASLAGQEEVVKLLLEHHASVNVQSQNGFTPLYMAAQENHDSVVKLLLSNGANQSLATEDGFTPLAVAMQQGHDKVVAVLLESDTRGKVRLPALHIAAKKDDVKAATLLLDNDHNPDVTSKSGFTPLHIASHYGNQNIANLLIQKGADVNYSAKHNISPLHVAAKWGKTNMVSLLLEKGANIEAKTRDGLTPLHCAARSGHEQVVDMLLERGAPISAKTKNGLAPLHMAAQGEHVDAARILLYHRAPVDEVTVDYLTALHVAAHCGHVRVAKLLLDRNADANARALNGFTPLHIACKKNRIKVVELLLRHGASISATTESGLTPLHVAAFMGCMNIVIYLLQHDASPDVPTVRGETPLHLAARANQTDIIRILLRNGAQVDARAREQQTPLHIASRLGNVDIVMLLLQHGAQVDATTKDMYTALHIAAKEGQDEVAAVLIENGAALDAATKKGFTPLHLTAKYGNIKVAQLLLQKEADVDAQGKNGVTPLHVACHYNNQNVALLLLEKGASPHATAKNGHTPLHIAARKNQMDIASTLLEYGAQANAESKAGFTPLHLSCQEGHTDISNLLIEHRAGVNHPAKNGLTPMHLCAQEDNVNVAEILQRNGANIDMATKAGYTPLHVASHFGQANMVRFLLQHGANVDASTSIGYTPLHQTAQQGHCHIVNLLLEHKANANAQTVNGQTPLHIARKLGYISVLDSLKSITNEEDASAQMDEKYRVVAPEAMHESFMSDSEEEGGEDNMLSDQPYRYLTVDEMKSLGDDSLPIDVTRDERIDSNRMAQSAEYAGGVLGQQQPIAEEIISPHKVQVHGTGKTTVDGVFMGNGLHDEQPHVGRKLTWKSFLVSFLVDARGGAMRGCRHSGVRMIVPSRSTCQPTRVTCRYVKPQRTMHPPQLMEGEALASRVLELGPVSTKFIGPVVMEVPHFASLRGKEREIVILRSDNGETWREHTIENSEEIIHDVMQQCFEPEEIAQLEEQGGNHVCRFVTYDFPQYFAVVSRIRQEVHAIGPEGGMVSSTVVPQVQAVFPQGALTKKIKVGLQAQPVDPDLTAKLLGRGVAVSPIVTVEPRRRKFHKAITLSMPAPKAHSQGMINQYSGNTPTLRLLCSITGGPSRAQWEDVTGSTPLTFVNDCVSFTTTVSARFWLMDCRNISEATKMATELYKEVIHVPFMAKFVVFAKKIEPYEARLRVFCMTDDREDKTLEKQELYTEVAKSRDVEVLEGKPQYIEMAGNLVPVTKSGDQLQLQFKAFRENRLPFTVRVKDQHADIVGRTLFMKEPKVAKGEPPQHPICILNIVLPETVIPDSTTVFSDKISATYRSSLFSLSKHQNDHYIGDIRIVDLSNLLGKDWVQLATEIGITTEEIDEIISHNTDSIARQAQSMIRLYKDKPNYDIHLLENALKNIGREDIMKKCKSGRLSHSRDFDDTDIMKNSESVEELVRQESKRIQHELDEVKYSAEEKEVEESESDEEITKRTVAERREKIVKRLSIERQIPASTQKREITREITEIKRKSLIEDKKAIHESEILMQLPTDNIIKSAIVPDQVIKMKMGKMDSTDISKSDFDKELTHKFKTSGRSSEEDDSLIEQKRPESVDNLKIVADIISAEKPSKLEETPVEEMTTFLSDTIHDTKKLTEDFLNVEKQTQLPSDITITEKFVEEVKEKFEQKQTKPTSSPPEKILADAAEKETKKVESIVSAFEVTKDVNNIEKKKSEHISTVKTTRTDKVVTETVLVSETVKPSEVQKKVEKVEVVEKQESKKIGDKIADFEAKSKIPKLIRRPSDETKITTVGPAAAPRKMVSTEKSFDGKKDVIEKTEINARKLTEDFISMEQKSQIPAPRKIKTDIQKVNETIKQIAETTVAAPIVQQRKSLLDEAEQKQAVEKPKVQEQQKKKEEIVKSVVEDKKTVVTTATEEPIQVKTAEKPIDKKIASVDALPEKTTVIDTKKLTHDFLSMEQQTQLPVTVTKIPVLKDEFKGLAGKVKTGVSEEISIPEVEHIAPFAEKPLEDLIKITSEIMTTVPSLPLDESICFTQDTFKDQKEIWSEERKKVEESTKEKITDSLKSVKHEVVEKPMEDFAKKTSETQKAIFETVDIVKKTAEKETVDLMKTFKTDEYSKIEKSSDVIKDAKETILQTKETIDITSKKEISKISAPFEEMKESFKTTTETVKETFDTKKGAVKEEAEKLFAPLTETVTKIETKKIIDDFKPTEETREATTKLVESVKKLEDAISIVGKSLDGIETAAPIIDEGKATAITTRKLTEDFLNMEQKNQLPAEMIQTQKSEIIQFEQMATLPLKEKQVIKEKEIILKESIKDIIPEKVLEKEIIPKESIQDLVSEKVLEKEIIPKESIKDIGLKETVKDAVPAKVLDTIKDAVIIIPAVDTTQDPLKLTSEFLAMEQRTQLPSEPKWSIEIETTTLISDELAPPMPIEPRKSLTDAEFCKSVQETITKKMSEGLIEISDELKMKEADIPHSQTPPPTPIDIKSEKHEEEQVLHTTSDIKDYLADTVTTLHKTTESTFERVSGISTTEIQKITHDIKHLPEDLKVTISPTKETSGEIDHSTDTTPVPFSAVVPKNDLPKPKPRSVVATSPISEFDDSLLTSTQEQITSEPLLTSTVDITSESSVTAPVPVPKPRSQLKQTDSYKNLASLAEQSDSISLRSLEFTEDISKTDEPSTDISIRSQRDLHTTETESFEPTSESVDDVDTEKSDQADGKTTSFYIGESSRNVIVKTTPTKSTSEFITDDGTQATIEAKDISLMKEVSVDSDENNDVFKEYVTMKRDQEESVSKLIRQNSDTRNDLLEQEPTESKQPKDALEKSVESSKLTSTISTDDSIKEISEISRTDSQEYTVSTIITESLDTVLTDKAYTSVEKSEVETLEKEIPQFQSKCKVIHSPQDLQVSTEDPMYKSIAEISPAETQLSLDSATDSLKEISKDIEMPIEIKTVISSKEKELSTSATIDTAKLSYASMQEEEDISSFIGIPEKVQEGTEKSFDTLQQTEGLFEGTVRETLNREAVMAHYARDVFNNVKPETHDDHGSLGFISTGTGEDYSSSEEHAAKEEHASLGFISTETAEDFSSMEDYYQEKMAKANVLTEESTTQKSSSGSTFEEITSDQTMKPFDVVIHRVKTESTDSTNRWSVPEIDQSSSSESYYKSFEKSESRPLSSDIENLLTQPNSSDYQTAADASSTFRETTEYVSAVSSFSSSGKTISSHESMRSLDSQSETSAYLGSIDVSELSETLVASSTEPDALEAEEIAGLHDLRADDEDSTESLDMDAAGYPIGAKQSLMKRSQEMIFKPKAEEITKPELQVETVKVEEFPKPKEVEKTWGLAYPLEEVRSDELKDMERTEDILLYHSDSRHSIDDAKLASSLDEGSILSVSMSSTSNIETVVENFEDMVGSVGSSSLTGVDGFQFSHDDPVSSYPDETFIMEMESKDQSPQDSTATTPPGEARKRGHKRSESTSITGEALKTLTDKELQIVGENKESESESDTDPYESEYARQFRSPNDRKKKKKQAAAEMDHSFETEKRPFTPSQLVAEVIVEDAATEELEAEQAMIEERRPSQNMQDYSNIPDITVTEHTQKSPIQEEESDKFEEKTLYKMKTQEELNKAADVPLYQKSRTELEEENFQKLVQEQYKQKLAELQRAQDSDYDENKAPDSPDSFEMVDQPDISDEFVIIEEVAKEANEVDLGGKSIKIKSTKYESKHDEDVENIIIKSAPADPKLGSQIYRDDLYFDLEESPPTAGSSSDQQDESDSGESAAANKRWVEMQLTDAQLRYPYDITGGVLEDIKEEDGEFEVGSSRISSFKDSFSSTPEYDVLAARRYFSRGEHDDISMSSLQEFESLEQAISLENRNKTHQGSTDSSNGSFTRRYIVRHSGSGNAQGDDISISSLKEFEGLENACIEAHLIEIKAKEEAALLSRSDESNKSNGSDRENGASNVVVTRVTRTVTQTEVTPGQQNIEALLKEKLDKCERKDNVVITEISSEPLDLKSTKTDPLDSEKGSVDSLEINKSLDVMTSSLDSFDISKDATTRSDIDSLETDKKPPTREESIESIENEQMDLMSKIVSSDGLTTTTKTTTTSTDADGVEHTVTHITTITTVTGDTSMESSTEQMPKDASIDSLCIEQTTSSAGTTATYQTSAGNSQMSGSVTSCASSTLMEDSYPAAMSTSTLSGSHWMHEDHEGKELDDADKKQQTQH